MFDGVSVIVDEAITVEGLAVVPAGPWWVVVTTEDGTVVVPFAR